jgi:hypothetical protein
MYTPLLCYKKNMNVGTLLHKKKEIKPTLSLQETSTSSSPLMKKGGHFS